MLSRIFKRLLDDLGWEPSNEQEYHEIHS
jgi:hypothetical protein